jgi:hypothetical protein
MKPATSLPACKNIDGYKSIPALMNEEFRWAADIQLRVSGKVVKGT